jgi:hypothetical protein
VKLEFAKRAEAMCTVVSYVSAKRYREKSVAGAERDLRLLGCGKDPRFEVRSVAAASLYSACGAMEIEAWKQTPKMLTDLANPQSPGGAIFKPGVEV